MFGGGKSLILLIPPIPALSLSFQSSCLDPIASKELSISPATALDLVLELIGTPL